LLARMSRRSTCPTRDGFEMEWIVLAGVVGVVIGIGWTNYRSAKEPATSRQLVMIHRLRETRDIDAVSARDPTTRAEASRVIDVLLECPRKEGR